MNKNWTGEMNLNSDIENLQPKNALAFNIENVSIYFKKNHIIKNINMEIPRYKVTSLIGPSGCGKSTILKALNRMHDYIPGFKIEGKITYDDKDIYQEWDPYMLRTKIGMVFQKPSPFPISIFDNVAYGPRIHGIKNKTKLKEIVQNSLMQAALWDEVKDKLHENALSLSGGQQQRLCISRAIALDPDILLMDEPTSALDPVSTLKIENLILSLRKKYTIVIVTHSMKQASHISDRVFFLLNGEVVESGKTKVFFTKPKKAITEKYITGRPIDKEEK